MDQNLDQSQLEERYQALLEREAEFKSEQAAWKQHVSEIQQQLAEQSQLTDQALRELHTLRDELNQQKNTLDQQRQALASGPSSLAASQAAADLDGEPEERLVQEIQELHLEVDPERRRIQSQVDMAEREAYLAAQAQQLEPGEEKDADESDELRLYHEQHDSQPPACIESASTDPLQSEPDIAATDLAEGEATQAHAEEDDEEDPFARLRLLSVLKENAEAEDASRESSRADRLMPQSLTQSDSNHEGSRSAVKETAEIFSVTHQQQTQNRADASAAVEDISTEQQHPREINRGDSGRAQSSESAVVQPARVSSTTHEPDSSAQMDDEEESIDAYMARLLNRVRGTAEETHKPAYKPQAGDAKSSGAAPILPPAALPKPTRDPEPVEAFQLSPPRPQPKEVSANLAAMRELGNLHTRSAISQYALQNLQKDSIFKGLIAVACLMVGGACIWLGFQDLPLMLIVGGLLFGVSGFFMVQAIVNAKANSGLTPANEINPVHAAKPISKLGKETNT